MRVSCWPILSVRLNPDRPYIGPVGLEHWFWPGEQGES